MNARHVALALVVLISTGSVVEVLDTDLSKVYSNYNQYDDCGLAPLNRLTGGAISDKSAPYIVNGWTVKHGEWPSLVLVNIAGLICSGVIVKYDLVLTAGHCLNRVIPIRYSDRRYLKFDASNPSEVVVGMSNRAGQGQERRVYRVGSVQKGGLYRERNISQHEADLGQVFLNESIEFNQYVQQACLPQTAEYLDKLLDSKKYTRTYVVGFGAVKQEKGEFLQPRAAQGLEIRKVNCKEKQYFETDICFGPTGKANRGICKGDSGAPVLVLDQNKRWTLVALATGAYNCNSSGNAQSAGLDKYLKLSKVLEILKDDFVRYPEPTPEPNVTEPDRPDPDF